MNKHRLPNHIKPERYKIFIKPEFENFTFSGQEVVFIELTKSATEIVLHARNLKVFNAKIKFKNFELDAKSIKYDKKSETISLLFSKSIAKGRAELKLEFQGILNDRMRGFYRSTYKHKGKEKYLATTQFESTDAREAFPSFDEPAHKAIFDVSIIVPKGQTAISNTLPSSIAEHSSGYNIVHFEPTPKMSTYLLAFIVGDFEYIEGKTKRGVLVRVFVTPGKKHQAKFALECGIKTLDFFEKYFAIPYPLPVLDMIAIPDFSAGAMENWGAVTYRETALLLDEKNSSAASKQWVASVIAHELAHQWFGNLVTMEWWTHLWLNEGFASYISYLAVDHMFPEWDMWTQFVNQDLSPALSLDALENTHPIEVEVKHPSEISEIFDQISYDKGASVIRMLASYLGEKNFQKGLTYYLKKHSYSNAKTEALWEAFEKASGKPVKKMMQNWTKKPGYPLVKVIQKQNSVQLIQQRYFSSPLSAKKNKDKTLWMLPLKYSVNNLDSEKQILFDKKTVELKLNNNFGWLKFNAGENSVARIDYPAQLLEAFKKPIESKKIKTIDRLGLLRDAFALAESGNVPTLSALQLLPSFKGETEYTIWAKMAGGVSKISDLFADDNFAPDLNKYFVNIFKNAAHKIGWNIPKREKHTNALLRSLLLSSAGHYGDENTIAHAKKLFLNPKKIHPDLRGVVYNLVAENGGEKEYDKLTKMYMEAIMQEEKDRLARALCKFKNKKLLLQTLNFAFSEKVKAQDTPFVVASVTYNPLGRDLAWNYVTKNWQKITKRYAGGGHLLPRFISPFSEFSSKEAAKKVDAFFKKHKASGAERTIKQTLENIYSNISWKQREAKVIKNWLNKSNY